MKREKNQKRKEQIIDNKDITPDDLNAGGGAPEKSRYQQIMDGDATPEGSEKGWQNLQPEKYNFAAMEPGKLKEISRKGAAAVNRLHGEKRTAREALEKILTLKATDDIIAGADLDPAFIDRIKRDNPDLTIYDLIQLVAAGRAVGGNLKAYELIRDTYGDKPVDKMQIDGAAIMTDADRALLEKVAGRLEDPELIIVKDDTGSD